MIPSFSAGPVRSLALFGLALTLLAGCKPHQTHGAVDEANAVTMEEVASLGLEAARAKYAGKIVTFKGPFLPVGVSSKNEERKNVCMQSFLHHFPNDKKIGTFEDAAVRVYFNYGDEIDGWFEHKPHRPEDLRLENPLVLDFDVCDTTGICNEGDVDQRCRFSSPKLLLTGKVAAIYPDLEERGLRIAIRPTGLRY